MLHHPAAGRRAGADLDCCRDWRDTFHCLAGRLAGLARSNPHSQPVLLHQKRAGSRIRSTLAATVRTAARYHPASSLQPAGWLPDSRAAAGWQDCCGQSLVLRAGGFFRQPQARNGKAGHGPAQLSSGTVPAALVAASTVLMMLIRAAVYHELRKGNANNTPRIPITSRVITSRFNLGGIHHRQITLSALASRLFFRQDDRSLFQHDSRGYAPCSVSLA